MSIFPLNFKNLYPHTRLPNFKMLAKNGPSVHLIDGLLTWHHYERLLNTLFPLKEKSLTPLFLFPIYEKKIDQNLK